MPWQGCEPCAGTNTNPCSGSFTPIPLLAIYRRACTAVSLSSTTGTGDMRAGHTLFKNACSLTFPGNTTVLHCTNQ